MMKIKSIKSSAYIFLICALVFSEILQFHGISFVRYLDELYELIAITIIAVRWRAIEKQDRIIILMSIAFVAVGLMGNVIYKFQTDVALIVLDIIATMKGILFYYGIKCSSLSFRESQRIVKKTSSFLRIMCYIMFLFFILNSFIDIGMSTGMRYGIKGFSFISPHEGTFSLMFYAIFSAFLCEAVYQEGFTKKNKTGIIAALILWCFSLRVRAIAFSLLFVVLALRFMANKKSKRIRFAELLGIIGASYLFAREQIAYYFQDTGTARYNLLAYGFVTLKRCFPIGAGFAAYGSEMAARSYSVLYTEYGFESVWGLSQNQLSFSNDSLWGELLGQFGMIGCLLFIVIFYEIFKNGQKVSSNNVGKFMCTYVSLIILLGSIGTKTIFHFTIVPAFMFLALAENYYKFSEAQDIMKINWSTYVK